MCNMQRSEDNLWELYGSWDQIQVIRFGGKCLYLQSHFTCPYQVLLGFKMIRSLLRIPEKELNGYGLDRYPLSILTSCFVSK